MKRLRHTPFYILLLLLLVACGEFAERAMSRAETGRAPKPSATTVTEGVELWDGGRFAGEPVFSRLRGPTWEALDAFAACGLDEEDMGDLFRYYVQSGSTRIGYMAGAEVGSAQEPLWSVFMELQPLTADVYHLSCGRTVSSQAGSN